MAHTDVPCARCRLNRATVTFAPAPGEVRHCCRHCIREICAVLSTGRR